MPTPISKGRFKYCPACIHYIEYSEDKYPCKLSHGYLKKVAGVVYSRHFPKNCPCLELPIRTIPINLSQQY